MDIPNRDEILRLLKEGKLTDKQQLELVKILEVKRRADAIGHFPLFASEYIKITDKSGETVPFNLNPIQKKLDVQVFRMKRKNRPVRVIILKARQHGITTYKQGRMLWNTVTKKNRNGLVIAHLAPVTARIFSKAKYMYDNLPAFVKPLQKASNATELIFDRPTDYKGKDEGLNSSIRIQTAGDTGIGRGDAFHYVHLSEVAYWPAPEGKGIKKQIAGILQAVPKTADTEVIIESTANGYNEFKDLWDEAVAGQNEWLPLFFPWFDNPEYAMECDEEEYNRQIRNLDNQDAYDYLFGKKDEPGIIELFKLSKEQVRWWIWTFRNDCNRDMNIMLQENPSTPDDAFRATGSPVFDVYRVKMRIAHLKELYKKNPPTVGKFTFKWNDPTTHDRIIDNSIQFVKDPEGSVTIYEDTITGVPYVIGGDTAGDTMGKGRGKDYYTGAVINNITGKNVATIRSKYTNSKPYTWQMYCMGIYFNTALIGIEVNWNTAPIEELERLNYPNQYVRRRYDDITKEYQMKHGWKTDGNTRPLIIDKEVHLIEENIDLLTDIPMLEECMVFIYNKDGRPEAMSGKHDDALFANMIANEIRSQQSFEADVELVRERRSFDEDTERRTPDYDESPWD